MGYLKIPKGVLIDIDETRNYSPRQIAIITTGSQGEPMSALTRMSNSEHKKSVHHARRYGHHFRYSDSRK